MSEPISESPSDALPSDFTFRIDATDGTARTGAIDSGCCSRRT